METVRVCDRCGFSTDDLDYWPKHLEAHAELDRRSAAARAKLAALQARPTMTCELCGFSTREADYWPVHLRAHGEG